MITKMKKAGNPVANRAAIKKLLDFLPKEWSLQCMMIKRDFLNNPNPTNAIRSNQHLKSFEMDVIEMDVTKRNEPAQILSEIRPICCYSQEHGISCPYNLRRFKLTTTNVPNFNNAFANSKKAPCSNEKVTMVGDAQALKISTKHVALFNYRIVVRPD
ncbi:hypothetical protein HanRHA438_Chr01g0027301 [Helianthus annuus]|nr:hypothetical protein HanRHA438_Chr01g0027301 [Helianthus annuus]